VELNKGGPLWPPLSLRLTPAYEGETSAAMPRYQKPNRMAAHHRRLRRSTAALDRANQWHSGLILAHGTVRAMIHRPTNPLIGAHIVSSRTPDDETAHYVIEHRHGDERTVIADGIQPLAPIAAFLKAKGATGDLVVTRRGTEELVIRWPLNPATDAQ
jgi:hypothetical protein